jgi:poly(3-hydroxybutyrate) depolymerase
MLHAQQAEPIDNLQWLAIESIVGPVLKPEGEHLSEAAAIVERARQELLAGRYGEARRLYSQARGLIFGGEWNAQSEFIASLALRPAQVAVDPSKPLMLAVGQHFQASAPVSSELEFRISARPWRRGTPADAKSYVLLTQARMVIPDLAEQPQYVLLDTRNLPDGSWELVTEVLRDEEVLGSSATRIFVARNLHRDLRRLREGLADLDLRDGLAASIAYPLDLAETLDLRTRNVRDIDLRAELDAALSLLAAAERGEDALWQARGNVARHYLSVSGRIEPYRLFVPEDWDGRSPLPLAVMLHGSMGDERSVFASGELERLAREREIAVLSPMGDDPNSVWGNRLPVVLADGSIPAPRPVVSGGRVQPVERLSPEPAEADVAATLALVRAEFPIDEDRIYLGGNSMGGEGTWHLAAKWPGMWAAIAPGAGPIDSDLLDYGRLAELPTLIVHGRHDPITSFAASQETLKRLKDAGGSATLLAPEAGHDAFGECLGQILDFFLSHPRAENGQS